MSALVYLFAVQLKNRIRLFFRKPLNIVIMVLMLGMLVMVVAAGDMSEGANVRRDMSELFAIIAALYVAMFAFVAFKGATQGASLFSMPDVHMLFPSPIDSRRMLIYGLIRQMGNSLLIGLFLLYQYSWMHMLYGVSFGFLVLVLVGYALTVFAAQLTAMTAFSATSANPSGRRIYKIALIGLLIAALAGAVIIAVRTPGDPYARMAAGANGLPMLLYPVGGWLAAGLRAMVAGDLLGWAVPLAGFVLFVAALTLYMARVRADYYEDVLQSTEMARDVQMALKEGRMRETAPANVKVGATGIGRGWGASAFLFKHRLEDRRARTFIFTNTTLIYMAVNILYGFFMRDIGLLPTFFFAAYMLMLSVTLTGRWVRELSLPYLFMVPEPPFKKLIANLALPIRELALEAVVTFGIIGLIHQLTGIEIALVIVARFTFSLLFMASTIVTERLFSGVKAKVLALFALLAAAIVLLLPGIALALAAMAARITLVSADLTVLIPMAIGNLIVAPIALYLCRDLTNRIDISA